MPVVDHAAAGQVQSRAADVIGIAGAGDQARAGDETRAFIAGDLTLPEPKPGLLGIVERLGGAVVESTEAEGCGCAMMGTLPIWNKT